MKFNWNIWKNKPTRVKTPFIVNKSISAENLRYLTREIVNDLIKNTAYISLNNYQSLIECWDSLSDLRTIISKISNYFIRVNLIHYKVTGKGLKDISDKSPLLELLNNPNPLQSRDEFLEELYTFWNICGNNFTYAVNGTVGFTGDYTKIKALYNINPALLTMNLKENIFSKVQLKDIVSDYIYKPKSQKLETPISVDDIIHINDVNINNQDGNIVRGNSKLLSLRPQITNLGLAYEAKNVLLAKRGALGLFTTGGNNQYAFPLSPEEKEEIQEEWSKYGLSKDQWQVIFTKASLVWQQIAMPTKDLQIFEGLEDDRQSMCAAYSLPYLLFKTGGGEGSTFSNLDTASKQVYREKIIPDWTSLEATLNKFFRLREKGELLKFEYSHIDVLQEDEKTKIEKQAKKTDGINSILLEYNSNRLSEKQAKIQLKYVWDLEDEVISDLLIKPEQTQEEYINNNEEGVQNEEV